jgi:hypothetical protein
LAAGVKLYRNQQPLDSIESYCTLVLSSYNTTEHQDEFDLVESHEEETPSLESLCDSESPIDNSTEDFIYETVISSSIYDLEDEEDELAPRYVAKVPEETAEFPPTPTDLGMEEF